MGSEAYPSFPFHYGQEAEQYTFYRVPKLLFTEPVFAKLSTDAKLLYGLLLDRMQLSIRNHWIDETGKVYIYFTVESIMEALACGNKKAGQLLAELDGFDPGKGVIVLGATNRPRCWTRPCCVPAVSTGASPSTGPTWPDVWPLFRCTPGRSSWPRMWI